MDYPELVESAMASLGVKTNRALARALGLTGQDASSRVGKWRNGGTAPNYEATLLLLRAAGLLKEPTAGSGGGASTQSPLQALAETVEALVTVNEEYGHRLAAVESALRQAPAPGEVRPSSKRRASGRR